MIKCSCCGKQIQGNYYIIGDNWLQVNYFENTDNTFCSKDCIIKYLSVLEIDRKTNDTYTIY